MQSEISVGARIADSVFELARLGRLPPDLATLDRFADGANAAIDAMANALEGKADVTPTARDAYVRGVLLALGVIRVLEPGPRRSRFRATAERLLDLVEPFVPDADRAKRAWLPQNHRLRRSRRPDAMLAKCYHDRYPVIMMRTQVSFDEKMYRRAQAEARKRGISLAELVRRAVGAVLEEPRASERPWMKWSGAIAGGDSHSSDPDRIDAVVYGRKR